MLRLKSSFGFEWLFFFFFCTLTFFLAVYYSIDNVEINYNYIKDPQNVSFFDKALLSFLKSIYYQLEILGAIFSEYISARSELFFWSMHLDFLEFQDEDTFDVYVGYDRDFNHEYYVPFIIVGNTILFISISFEGYFTASTEEITKVRNQFFFFFSQTIETCYLCNC